MLIESGVSEDDVYIVESVTNEDLKIICPKAGEPRVTNPQAGAKGHSFVAVKFPDNKWKIINPIDGSRTYGRANWYAPEDLQKLMTSKPVSIPSEAFASLPKEIYASGLTAFQSWKLKEAPKHTFEQRYDLVASGKIGGPNDSCVKRCRFTAP